MLKLVKLNAEYKKQLFEMMDEWTSTDEKIIPWSIIKNDYKDFDNYIKNMDLVEASDGLVPDSTFFALDTDRNIFVGAVNIRHYLNETLLKSGGHIGDGIRPSERKKGYGTLMIGLALDECRKLGMCEVLMVCHKDNIASKKTIINNGGVLENVISDSSGREMERYWINLEIPKNKILMPELLDKFSDCDSFSLTCIDTSDVILTKDDVRKSFEEVKKNHKDVLLEYYNKLENKDNLLPFDILYKEVEEECILFNDPYVCDRVGIDTKYSEPIEFFWHFYHLISDNIKIEKELYSHLKKGKITLSENVEDEVLKNNLIRCEIVNYNHCTISGGLMINYYFHLNEETRKWLLQFRSDFHLSGTLDDLAFYKNNEIMFSSCTHELYNSLGEEKKI